MLSACHIENFRILTSFQCSFDPALTLITGPNGSGKTSLLEAVYFATNGRSFRTRFARKLTTFQQPGFAIRLDMHGHRIHVRYDAVENSKNFTLDENREKISSITSQFPVFVFFHRSMGVVRGTGMERYRFVNKVLSRLYPAYGSILASYRKALYQKRILLKNGAKSDIILTWNQVLEERRERLRERRQMFCDMMNKILAGDVQIQYRPNQPGRYLNDFLQQETVTREVAAGAHLDRFRIVRKEKDIREYGSSGQQKDTFFQILRSVGILFRQEQQVQPVLLLDDFDAEFDEMSRVRNLQAVLDQFQVVVTTTEEDRFRRVKPGMIHRMDVKE